YALVTGGAVRLGAFVARRLAADGWAIAVHYRNHDKDAQTLAAELAKSGVETTTVGGDLGDAAALPAIYTEPMAALGHCTRLVNSAWAFEYDEAGTVTAATMDPLYAANFRAPFLLSPHFADQLPADEKGLIVNILDQKVFNLNPDFFS